MSTTVATILISITVLNTASTPLVGAAVFCDAELNVTDSQGRIVFDVEPGRHWIRIHKDGYVDAEFEHVFTGERPDIVVRLRRIP